MKKGKNIVTVSIGCIAFVLTMIMFTQFKTVEETDITGIEVMREAELRTELSSWKNKYKDATVKLSEIENKINGYNNEIQNSNDITALLEDELNEARMYAGLTDVSGEGIIVTLSDTKDTGIEAADIIQLVNELKLAGAEAISVNDERITATTDISNVNYKYIFINTSNDNMHRIASPYVIKAIGNRKYLESAITVKYGFLDEMESYNKSATYTLEDNIIVKKSTDNFEYKYAKEVKE